jgi:hypothetical protein
MALTFGPGISIGPGISLLAEPPTPSGSANFVSANNQFLNATTVVPGTPTATYEWWVYINSFSTTAGMLNTRTNGTTANSGFLVYLSSTGGATTATVTVANASGTTYSNLGIVSLNTWYHMALVRTGSLSNWAFYLNGVRSASTITSATAPTSTALYLGTNNGSTLTLDGYISNFRFVKGVAVYTGTFTVPTSPLTATQSAGANISAVTGTQTQLLLNTVNGSNFLQDSSTFNITVTNNNGVTSNALNPFGS